MGYVRMRTWQVRKQKKILEKQVLDRTKQIVEHQEEIEAQRELLEEQNRKILEMDQMKTMFFNNISHEFRTPLTLIQGPVEDLVEHARLIKKDQNKLQLISRNARRLLNLVNQLLDVAKLDSGHMKLKLVNGDILQSLRIIAGSFSSLAETQGILYNRSIPMGKYNTWFDFNVLEKIVDNLLSNAFKFTPEAGEITFRARWFHGETTKSPDQLEFSVADQGPGIPENSIDKIFTRFYQIEGKGHQITAGTGIGLSLVRNLVNLNHGEIMVKSEIGIGSTFTVRLPLGKDHLKESEYIIATEKEEFQHITPDTKEVMPHVSNPNGGLSNRVKEDEHPIVLIVDDNGEIRSHISENLENKYQIIEAVNGRAGLKKAQEVIPDLMITDLIMPVMDGIELCSQMKIDERTSHIPIVMLTAKSSLEEKLEGLETGADDYLSKPFHMKELKIRIANLIEQRKKLRERFSKEITLEPCEIAITSLDEAFLNRAINTIENNLNDEEFDTSKFQKAMNMSHSTLFRKLQALTNLSPSGFIRNIRLKRAAQLLREHYGNITEVSYEVGFSNPSYFSKCFKSLFGTSPADYMKRTLYEV
jgi:signal transduction histidine kinase/DNA-binding response OmpR family regulator